MLPLLAAMSIGFAAGCGSDTVNSTAPVGGRVYAVTSGLANQLLVYTGQNNASSGTTSPSVAVNIPVIGPVACRLDRSRDRLYVACDGGGANGAGRLLAYDNVSQINSGTQPTVNIGLAAGSPEDMTYDATRDILYIGDRNGLIATLRSASTATSGSTVAFAQVGNPPLTLLNSVLIEDGADRLITAAASANTAILSLPVFNNASTTLTSAGSINPAGLTNAADLHFENSRLLVLDGVEGTVNTRILRYEAPFGGVSPSLIVNNPNATCLQYDAGQDNLYVGQSTNVINVYSNFATQTNTLSGVTRTLNSNAFVEDISVDNTRN